MHGMNNPSNWNSAYQFDKFDITIKLNDSISEIVSTSIILLCSTENETIGLTIFAFFIYSINFFG